MPNTGPKPLDATHLENECPEEIPPGVLLEDGEDPDFDFDEFYARVERQHALVRAGASVEEVVAAAVPDPTDEVLLSPNCTAGMPQGGWQGVTIHTMEGNFGPSVNWLRNPASQASAHFCVREDGHITQLVWEHDRAWHAKSSGMFYLGIEHDGSGTGVWVNGTWIPKKYKTPANATKLLPEDKMLVESARLVAYLCVKYKLEIQHDWVIRRNTKSVIAGHDQMDGNDHTDPSAQFPWKAYMNAVSAFVGGKAPSPAPPKPKPEKLYRVQVGAFTNQEHLRNHVAKLKADGYGTLVVKDGRFWKVQCGAFANLAGAKALEAALEKDGYDALVVSSADKAPVEPPKPTKPPSGGIEAVVARIFAFIAAYLGILYRFWWSGEVPSEGPAWAKNGPPPSADYVRRQGMFCAAVGNLIRRFLGLVIPHLGNELYDGGTVAWVGYFEQRKKLKRFVRGKRYRPGTVLLRAFRDANDQGHWAMVWHDNLCFQCHIERDSGWPGVNKMYTVDQSNDAPPDFYEYVIEPEDVWLKAA